MMRKRSEMLAEEKIYATMRDWLAVHYGESEDDEYCYNMEDLAREIAVELSDSGYLDI